MEGERRERQVLHRQARELVYNVFSYFKREADAGMPVHDVAKAQKRTAEVQNISIRNEQRVISNGNVAVCISLSLSARHPPSFVSVTLVMYYTAVSHYIQACFEICTVLHCFKAPLLDSFQSLLSEPCYWQLQHFGFMSSSSKRSEVIEHLFETGRRAGSVKFLHPC
jgi:hypothetical protein